MSQNLTTFIKQHAVTTVMGLLVSGALLFFTLRVQAIGDARYVTQKQFESYITAHQNWSNEVIKRLEGEHQADREAMNDLKEEIKLLRQEIQQRRPPPKFPQNGD